MYYCLFILCACLFIELVTANPLMHSIPSCPHYQQNVYRPYNDVFILQPNNINPYPQQIVVQNPLPYQPIQELLVQDHIPQVYWDKILSNPIIKSIIDPNYIINNRDANDMKITSRNPFVGDVVNNYIIVPPEYFNINETAHEQINNRVDNNLKDTQKDNGVRNSGKKKGFTKNTVRNDVLFDNIEMQREKKHLRTIPRNFDATNIKCYTSSEVLEDISSKIDKKHGKNKEKNKTNRKNAVKSTKSCKVCDNNVEKIKSRKSKNNKIQKKLTKSEDKDNTVRLKESNSLKTTKKRKSKQQKSKLNNCECVNKADIKKGLCENKAEEKARENCDQFAVDLFDLKQDCIDLENRRTRNSKNDAAVKDYGNIYPNLPDDIAKNYLWYMNDLISNPMITNSDTNLFSGNNMYPYDLNQFYKMPQYSNTDTNKPNKNKGRSRNTKRKKKQKRKNSTNNKNEGNASSEKDNNAPKSSKLNIGKEPKKAADIQNSIIDKIESTENKTEMNTKNLTTVVEILSTDQSNSIRKNSICESDEPVKHIEVTEILNSYDTNERAINTDSLKRGQIEIKEIFETQIPESVNAHKADEDNTEELQDKEKMYDELQFIADSYEFEQTPELGDDIPYVIDYRILEDYYPDFTNDNHAYLESSEEINVQNTRDRYFYTTDKNIESQDSYQRITDQSDSSKDRINYNNNNADKGKLVQSNADKSRVKVKKESEEIIFRAPPGLDFPDFITRKIDRNRQDSSEIFYQHDNDEEYDRFNFDNSADNSDQYLKTTGKYVKPVDHKSGNVVETVYARSKVVKYGQSQVSEKTSKPKASSRFRDVSGSTLINDEDKTIVIAKSLSPEDSW